MVPCSLLCEWHRFVAKRPVQSRRIRTILQRFVRLCTLALKARGFIRTLTLTHTHTYNRAHASYFCLFIHTTTVRRCFCDVYAGSLKYSVFSSLFSHNHPLRLCTATSPLPQCTVLDLKDISVRETKSLDDGSSFVLLRTIPNVEIPSIFVKTLGGKEFVFDGMHRFLCPFVCVCVYVLFTCLFWAVVMDGFVCASFLRACCLDAFALFFLCVCMF